MQAVLRTRLAFFACVAIWGSTWMAIKVGYEGIDPLTGAALRFGLAAVALVALGLAWRKPLLPREPAHWALALFVGVVLFAADYGLIYWGEQWITSGMTAVLFALMPLLVALCAHVYVPGERLTPRKTAGILLGVLGTGVVFRRQLVFDPSLVLPMGAIVLSAFCAATATVAMKRHGKSLHGITLNVTAMAVGSLVLFLAAALAGERIGPPTTGPSWLAVLYLALAGSVTTFLLYTHVVQNAQATTASLIAPLTPVVALTLGALLLGERVTWEGVLGAALIIGGVLIAVTAKPRPAAAPARRPEPVPAEPPRR